MENNGTYFKREKWVYIGLICIALAIVGKLFWLQIVAAADLESRGLERRTVDSKVLGKRGTIYDAQNRVLAQSIKAHEVSLDPQFFKKSTKEDSREAQIEEYARQLSEILNVDYDEVKNCFYKDVSWVRIARYADLEQVNKIKALNIPGIRFTEVQKRVYPLNTLASHILGIVNYDGNGVEGLEYYYDRILHGSQGYSSQQVDTGLRSIFRSAADNALSHEGYNLHLTLDSHIQFVVEQQLDKLQEQTKADRLIILAMDPMTGKILAMGSRPTFDPNDFINSTPEQRKNLAISLTYEPGSTFKIITGAAALEEGILTPDTVYHDPGYLRISNRTITNWDSYVKSHGDITFSEAMQQSSNVVLAQVGEQLGKEKFYTYLQAFGFGKKTGVDLAGEESGLLLSINDVRPIDLATMSFGQTNLVTPIQLLTAVCAIANGGTLYQPYIVEKITDSQGKVIEERQPKPVRQVISAKTAAQMTGILEKVVSEGTGKLAAIPGIKVAGKTGTAQKVDPNTGEYSRDEFIPSFVAFAPADDPKIAVLVVIDNPKGESYYGGTLGGPVAKEIIKSALEHYGILPDNSAPNEIPISDENTLPKPSPNEEIEPERNPEANEVVVPDFTGLTMREAGEVLSDLKLRFHFEGSGFVIKQSPAPGKVVKEGSLIELRFSLPDPASEQEALSPVDQNSS